MAAPDATKLSESTQTLTVVAYVSFVPVGIATVLLGPMLPTLSARWSLNYSQAGALFTVQYLASTCAVALSGVLASRWGFRFPLKAGLGLMALGLALLLSGPKWLGILCIGTYGGGLGLATPAANLMVAAVNPNRRSAALSRLNFFWSSGAVACPFLVALAAKRNWIPLFLAVASALSLIVAIGISAIPERIVEPVETHTSPEKMIPLIQLRLRPFLILAALFFVYVGTENAFGGWVASFAKSLGNLSPAMSLMTPSFFYASLTVGRWLAPFLLRLIHEVKMVEAGLLLACGGTAGLVLSHHLTAVLLSACAAGLGLSAVYPITIALLSKVFGPASSRVGSVMFVLSNIGGGLLPWAVGVLSNHAGTITAGLFVPLAGCAGMFLLYLRYWNLAADTPLEAS